MVSRRVHPLRVYCVYYCIANFRNPRLRCDPRNALCSTEPLSDAVVAQFHHCYQRQTIRNTYSAASYLGVYPDETKVESSYRAEAGNMAHRYRRVN